MSFKPDNLNNKKQGVYRNIRTFADYKRKTGISPSLSNKDRGTSIRKTISIMDYGQTKDSQVLPGTIYYLIRTTQTYEQGII